MENSVKVNGGKSNTRGFPYSFFRISKTASVFLKYFAYSVGLATDYKSSLPSEGGVYEPQPAKFVKFRAKL